MRPLLLILSAIIAMALIGCASSGVDINETSEQTAEVYKSDGSLQCDKGTGVSIEKMASELTGNGITVISSYRDVDGYYRMALCGTDTGAINVYEIYESDLDLAKSLGFKPASGLPGLVDEEEEEAAP